ncbi:MAG: hypothetical protein MK008_14120 [Bdellovibrionales bacterium]|nr:hypothetical protein [Bdellovibrionales bacterium]
MIVSMLAITAFSADKGQDYFQSKKVKKSANYKRAMQLYKEGCKNIEQGFVYDTNKCIASFDLLKKIAIKYDHVFDVHFHLGKIYVYQPQSFNWRAKPESNLQLKELGMRHLRKALKINPNHFEAKKLYSKLDIKKASSAQAQGL